MKRFLVLTFLACLAGPAWAASGYTIDKAHSSIGFSITHMMISHTTGTFADYDGEILFSPDDLAGSHFDFTVQAKSIDTRNEARDNHLRSADFFEVEKYPVITFKSRKVEHQDGDVYILVGDMTIKDVTKEVSIPVTILGPVKSPFGPGTAIGISAKFQLNRQDYNIRWNKQMDNGGVLIGDMVDAVVNIEASAK